MFNMVNIAGGILILSILLIVVFHKLHNRRLDRKYYDRRWQELQQKCSDKKLWYQAVVEADSLLDEALKRRHFHGKTTGERLVAAQRNFKSNDAVWFGHKLRNKIEDQNYRRLGKKDTLEALAGFRQALKDLGALNDKKLDQTDD